MVQAAIDWFGGAQTRVCLSGGAHHHMTDKQNCLFAVCLVVVVSTARCESQCLLLHCVLVCRVEVWGHSCIMGWGHVLQ